MEYGEMCIGEFVRYGVPDAGTCTDDVNSCERDLCECDRAFSIDHADKSQFYDQSYHRFFGGFDANTCGENRPQGGAGVSDPQCCKAESGSGHYVLYNAAKKACCSDGRIVSDPADC